MCRSTEINDHDVFLGKTAYSLRHRASEVECFPFITAFEFQFYSFFPQIRAEFKCYIGQSKVFYNFFSRIQFKSTYVGGESNGLIINLCL